MKPLPTKIFAVRCPSEDRIRGLPSPFAAVISVGRNVTYVKAGDVIVMTKVGGEEFSDGTLILEERHIVAVVE